jgi:vacuolar-type H+-ATPase subunit H
MNEKRIQQVLEIEKQAQQVHDAALREAQQIPIEAEQKAQALLERARAQAQEQARKLAAPAEADAESARILSEAGQKNQKTEALAMSNFDRAVSHVIEQVIGRE